jgi:hypothetical protein
MQRSLSHEGPAAAFSSPADRMPAMQAEAKAAVRDGLREPTDPRAVGKYLVSPLVKLLANGWFASSVSIRSGSGSGTTDRILRMTPLFRCAKEAATYAHAEALRWIALSRRPLGAA